MNAPSDLGFAHPLTAPSRQGIMVGFPPPANRRVGPTTPSGPELLGWRVQNPTRMFPSARIPRGDGPVVPLPPGEPLDVEALAGTFADGTRVPMTEILHRTVADSVVVLHDGRVVYERYLGDMAPAKIHAIYSCTKSFVGLLVESLILEGRIDPAAPAAEYVPELARSPLGSAAVRQLLDMGANFKFGDQPKVEGQVQVDYLMGLGFIPRPRDYAGPNGACELLVSARPMGEHGGVFRYDNGCTDTLAWILRRVSGRSVDELIGERIWSRLGAEHDASISLDGAGTEWAAGGLAVCLRDLARVGEMVRCGGRWNGEQLIDAPVLDRIRKGGDRALFAAGQNVLPDGSYRSQFWFYHDRHDAFAFRGQYGQRLWIAPRARTVIATCGADPLLATQEPLRLAGFQAIADALTARHA